MRIIVGFNGDIEIEVDEKYKVLDTDNNYTEKDIELVRELMKEAEKIIKNKINNFDINFYDFNYGATDDNIIWDL